MLVAYDTSGHGRSRSRSRKSRLISSFRDGSGGLSVDQSGLLKSETPYGIAASTRYYDRAGRESATTTGAGTTCSTYDNEGRLTQDQAPGESQPTTYSYDPAGVQRTATNSTGTVTSEYDEARRLKRTVDSFGASANYAYDSESNLLQRIASIPDQANYTTTYIYDAGDRLTSETDPASRTYSFFYTNRDELKATRYPNGTFSWSDYNADGSLAALYNRHGLLPTPLPPNVPADSNPVVDYAYTFDIDGKQIQEVRSGGGLTARTTSYAYDNLDRLSQATLPGGTCRKYLFDLDSNRSAIQEASTGCGGTFSTTASYVYDAQHLDELQSVTQGQPTNFAYTSDGQVSTRGSATLTWDGRGRLSGGTFAGSNVTYSFDSTGFRRERNVVPSPVPRIRRYLLGGLFERDGAGNLLQSDIDGPAGDLAHYAGAPTISTTVSYLYYSGHGDLAAEANALGTRTAAYSYDPFGAPNESVPDNTTTERWTGRWRKKLDTATSLIAMGARSLRREPWPLPVSGPDRRRLPQPIRLRWSGPNRQVRSCRHV